jgi:hypothetical protein
LTYSFTALANGSSGLYLSGVQLADQNAQSISGVVVNNEMVTMGQQAGVLRGPPPTPTPRIVHDDTGKPGYIENPLPSWDVNEDGVENVYDIILIGKNWLAQSPPCWIREDTNCDGVVNVYDLINEGPCWLCIFYPMYVQIFGIDQPAGGANGVYGEAYTPHPNVPGGQNFVNTPIAIGDGHTWFKEAGAIKDSRADCQSHPYSTSQVGATYMETGAQEHIPEPRSPVHLQRHRVWQR